MACNCSGADELSSTLSSAKSFTALDSVARVIAVPSNTTSLSKIRAGSRRRARRRSSMQVTVVCPIGARSLQETYLEITWSHGSLGARNQRSHRMHHTCYGQKIMLRHNLSKQQMASSLAAAANIFDLGSLQATQLADDAKEWQTVVRLFFEHMKLRDTVVCQRYQKRENVTRAEVSSRHPEIRVELREGYAKTMRRLEMFRQRTGLPFPPNCGGFLRW